MMKTPSIFDTGIKFVRNVNCYVVGKGSIHELPSMVNIRRQRASAIGDSSKAVFLIDGFFKTQLPTLESLKLESSDYIYFIDTENEPTTHVIDALVANLHEQGFEKPAAIIGMGGGITLDTAKAVSNLLPNGGSASDYQGWDLVKIPGIHKIGIPTISGTGAEATRTCVLTNKENGLKLGMNSDHTVFDQIILDSDLTRSVPRNQYFYTGMDAYIHCIEALSGRYRNALGDAYSRETINLCRHVFLNDDMMSDKARDDLMVASYLGGCAIATSYVGVVHPFSAGLSVVLGIHHCLANCIVMRAMSEFYPEAYTEFWRFVDAQEIAIPEGVCRNLTEAQYQGLIDATIIHQKPLTNALGAEYRTILTDEKIVNLFKMM